MFHDFDAIA